MIATPPIQPGALRDSELTLVLQSFAPHQAHRVPTYHFAMIHAATGEPMGRINLRIETTTSIELYAGHVGYAVHAEHRGHRYASRSVALLLPLARQFGIDPLWITCDPENAASRRSCELAGAEFVEIVDLPQEYIGYAHGQRQKCRYRLSLLS
jgi:predicted acetyltransferase